MSKRYPRYMGIDLSLSCPGFAVVEVRRRKPFLLYVKHVKTNSKLNHGDRLAHVAAYFDAIYYDFEPFEAIIREKAFHNSRVNATESGYKTAAAIDLCLRGRHIEDIPNTSVKKEVAGKGNAGKDEVRAGVARWFPKQEFKTDDESDAVAVALTYLLREKIIDPI